MIKARKCSLEGISPHKIKLENTKKKKKHQLLGTLPSLWSSSLLRGPQAGKVCSKVLTLKWT